MSNEFKGTPGPWQMDEYGNIVSGEKNGWGRAETVRVSGVSLPGRVTGEYAANSALVVAAPELLNALQKMLGKAYKQNWNEQYPEELQLAQSAINKALGK